MPTLIYCAAGNPRFAELAIRHGFAYGAQLPATIYYPPYFVDQNWKKPQYLAYLAALRKHRPYLASVLDWEHEHRFDEIMMRAEEISQYCSEVMIIPKVPGGTHRIPYQINGKPVRLGYSVPTAYGATPVQPEEFGARPVHLLGGSPARQYALSKRMNVVSVDGNYVRKIADYGRVWIGRYRDTDCKDKDVYLLDCYGRVEKDINYISFELSLINLKALWGGCPAMLRHATENDLPAIKAIANCYKKELGFVMLPALRKAIAARELQVAVLDGSIVGFCNWHKRKDGWSTVYEIAVHPDYHSKRIGRALLAAIPGDIRLKCTVENPANEFYARVGFACVGTEDGRKHPLNVWQRLGSEIR